MQLHHKEKGLPVAQDKILLGNRAKSSLVSRNVTISGHRTSVRLEPDMWSALRDICRREHASMHELATAVHARKPCNTSLTAALRVFVMAYFRAAATEDGHNRAGHGPGGAFMQALVQHAAGGYEDSTENSGGSVIDYRMASRQRLKR